MVNKYANFYFLMFLPQICVIWKLHKHWVQKKPSHKILCKQQHNSTVSMLQFCQQYFLLILYCL